MIDQRLLEQIVEANDIVSVVEQYLPLKKTGSNFKACCPFHEENTPSFVVSERKQIYKCFGCGKGGNVIHFVKEMEKVSFFEALEKMASRAGITLPTNKKEVSTTPSKTALLITVYELAKDYYCDNLHKFGDSVIDYLQKRHITKEMMVKFQLGYAPNSSNGLYNYLLKHSINKDIMVLSGLIGLSQYGYYDVFKDRLTFPIHSASGKIVAFGARKLSEDLPGGKYINSPSTPIYTKGNELYGFYLTKGEIGKKNAALITEGYFDFIRLYESGFTNSVASLGTAFTLKQTQLISRYASQYYILYDGDAPGRKAAVETAKNIILAGQSPLIVELPQDEDADSYLQNEGAEKLGALIDKAKTLPLFLAQDESLQYTEKDKIEFLIDLIGNIPDLLTAELLTKQVVEIFKITSQAVFSRISRKKNTSAKTQDNLSNGLEQYKYIQEKSFLIHLVNGSITDIDTLNEITPDFFFIESYKKVFELLTRNSYIIGNGTILSILADLEDKEPMLVNLISELCMEEPSFPLEATVVDLKLRKYKTDLNALSSSGGNMTMDIISKKKELIEEIRRLSSRVINRTI